MLDGQTPYVKVITDSGDNVMLATISVMNHGLSERTYNEAAIDAKTQAHQHEDKSDLIRPESQGAWPESQCRS